MAIESTDAVPTMTETALVLTSAVGPSVVKERTSVAIPLNYVERLEKFTGQRFLTEDAERRKMFFYLTMLNLVRFLMEDAPKPKECETNVQVVSAIDAWHHSDFLCKNYVMNGLSDTLYNVYIRGKKKQPRSYGSS